MPVDPDGQTDTVVDASSSSSASSSANSTSGFGAGSLADLNGADLNGADLNGAGLADPAVKAAMEVFWRQGYGGTSIEDVVRATGVNRYAIYKRIGGKKELFAAALDCYHQERKAVFLKALNDPDASPVKAIRDVLLFAVSEMVRRNAGCLMCNVAINLGDHDPEISAYVDRYLAEIELAYLTALRTARDRGILNKTIEPENAARLLITVMLGLGVHSKNQVPVNEMENQINSMIDLLCE